MSFVGTASRDGADSEDCPVRSFMAWLVGRRCAAPKMGRAPDAPAHVRDAFWFACWIASLFAAEAFSSMQRALPPLDF